MSYSPKIEKLFSIFVSVIARWQTYLMKVQAFVLEWKSGKFQKTKEESSFSSLVLYDRAFCTITIRVWGCFIWSRVFPEPPFR